MTRGQRNNNPLNIRRTADHWLGMCLTQKDPSFVCFVDVEFGIRAAIKIILRYITHYKCDSLRKIVTRWAPPSENATERYIEYVAARAGVKADETITASDQQTIILIVCAMAYYESLMVIEPSRVKEVWQKYLPNTQSCNEQ